MGSKRSSSKSSKPPSIPPPTNTPPDQNFQNPSSHIPDSPFKSHKKHKPSIPNSTDSNSSQPVLPPKTKKHKPSTPNSPDSNSSQPVLPPKTKKHKPSTPNSPNSNSSQPILPPKTKKHKPSTTNSSSPSLIPSADGEALSQNINRKKKTPEISSEITPKATLPTSIHWSNLKFLESLLAFRTKHGVLPNHSNMADYLTEISDWAPSTLSEKNVLNKIRHLRYMFQKNPELPPESSEHDRALYKLRLQLWGPESLKVRGSAVKGRKEKAVTKKLNSEKQNAEKQNAEKQNAEKQNADVDDDDDVKEDEEEGDDEKGVQNVEMENIKEHENEKDDVFVGEDNGLLDGDVTEFPYKYLKLALEEYWMEAKLNMNTLYLALPKVDPVQAKVLDEQYSEVFKGMLKLKMEKNEMFNTIIRSSLGD